VFIEFLEEWWNAKILKGPADCENIIQLQTDTEALRHWYQTGLETPVVNAVNDECSNLFEIGYEANAKTLRLGSTVARVKLKAIDGSFFQAVEYVF